MSTTIVLCGGPLNQTSLPIGTNASNAMVPVNGKPVIGWILDDLIRKGAGAVTVVLRRQNERLAMFLTRAYEGRLALTLAYLDHEGSIVESSLAAGIQSSTADGPVRIVLGDTLIADAFEGDVDFVYAGEVDDSRRWCILRTDSAGLVVDFADKQELPGRRHLAAAGYYHLLDRRHLEACVADCLADGRRELSAVLDRYAQKYPLLARRVKKWYDFGHIDNFTRARRELLQSRVFNSLSVNPVLNTITKISTDNQKLEDELNWYLTIPDELKVLTPRVVSHKRVDGNLEIVQEYYGYPTLAELYVYSDLPADVWRSILKRVLRIHEEFRRYKGEITDDDVAEMYVGKTERRLQALTASDPFWAALIDQPEVEFNGRRLRNVPELLETLEREGWSRLTAAVPGIVHGDLCFSNILFDFNNQIIRLIDPRGRFGREGIYGDVRYDLAKLRHSVHGLYDFIVADMFQIQADEESATGRIFADDVAAAVCAEFDCQLRQSGFDPQDIQLLEGLLFLSMLPLHRDHPRRQLMMFYTGLQLLNEAL